MIEGRCYIQEFLATSTIPLAIIFLSRNDKAQIIILHFHQHLLSIPCKGTSHTVRATALLKSAHSFISSPCFFPTWHGFLIFSDALLGCIADAYDEHCSLILRGRPSIGRRVGTLSSYFVGEVLYLVLLSIRITFKAPFGTVSGIKAGLTQIRVQPRALSRIACGQSRDLLKDCTFSRHHL